MCDAAMRIVKHWAEPPFAFRSSNVFPHRYALAFQISLNASGYVEDSLSRISNSGWILADLRTKANELKLPLAPGAGNSSGD